MSKWKNIMRRLLLLCNSEVKSTFEQIFEVGAAGAENHLVDIFIYFIYISLYIFYPYTYYIWEPPCGLSTSFHRQTTSCPQSPHFPKGFWRHLSTRPKKGLFSRTIQFFRLSIEREFRGTTFLVGSKPLFLMAAENALANLPDNYSTSSRIGRTSWISLSTFFSSSGKKEDFVDSFSSSQQLGERYI